MEFDFNKQPGKKRIRFFDPDPNNALVSVITPYYNAGKYFEQTFNSVMNQTFPWFEWIIVNDGSTNQDDVETLQRFAAMDSRIRIITQENGGLSCARNTGIANAHTDFVVPLDADDLIGATYLECLYWSLYFNPDASWSYCDTYGFQDQEYIWKYPFDALRLKEENYLVATAMLRKKAVEEVGGYKVEKWSYFEDWRFWLDMLALGKTPVHVGTPMFWYRRLNKGMLASVLKDPERVKFCDNIIRSAGENVQGSLQATEYPVVSSKRPFHASKKIEWNRKIPATKEKRRVMWLVPWLKMGGADKFNLDAIAGLNDLGFENYILTTSASDNEWKQRFEEYTDELFFMADFLDPANYMEFISYFIQSRDIDVIMLSNSYDGYYMMPWIRQQFPDIAIVDYVHMEEWYWREGGYARTSGALSQITEKTYVCNSRTRNVLIEHFGRKAESVECLYIGVDHIKFSRDAEPAGFLHDLLKLPADRPVILFPCRIHHQKRPFMMLDIAERVQEILHQVAFVVAGDGVQLEDLKEKIKQRGLKDTVYCIGSTDKMRACYRDSVLTLICSLKEGLALTAYESLSMGVPVVSSDVGGQGDLIGPDVGALIPLHQEETDILREDYDPEEIDLYVTHICRILQDTSLYAELSENCRSKIVNGFSTERMVGILGQELEKICTEERFRKQRHSVSAALNVMDNLAMDYYTIYQQWAIERDKGEAVWKSRCWFEKLYNQTQRELEAARNSSFKGLVKELIYKVLRKIKRKIKHLFR